MLLLSYFLHVKVNWLASAMSDGARREHATAQRLADFGAVQRCASASRPTLKDSKLTFVHFAGSEGNSEPRLDRTKAHVYVPLIRQGQLTLMAQSQNDVSQAYEHITFTLEDLWHLLHQSLAGGQGGDPRADAAQTATRAPAAHPVLEVQQYETCARSQVLPDIVQAYMLRAPSECHSSVPRASALHPFMATTLWHSALESTPTTRRYRFVVPASPPGRS